MVVHTRRPEYCDQEGCNKKVYRKLLWKYFCRVHYDFEKLYLQEKQIEGGVR